MNSGKGIQAPNETGALPDPAAVGATLAPDQSVRPARARHRRRKRRGVLRRLAVALALLTLVIAVAGLALSGARMRLPVWAVAQAEARINRMLDAPGVAQGASVVVGGVEAILDRDWVPRLVIDDLRLLDPQGRSVVQLPEVRLSLDAGLLLRGQVRPQSLRIQGAQLALTRLADGRFDLGFGSLAGSAPGSVTDMLDQVEAAFEVPLLKSLDRIEAAGLTLSLTDRRAGRVWQVGDGRLTLDNRPDEIALGLGFGLVAGGAAPARADLTFVSRRDSPEARVSGSVDRVAAADLAAQAPELAWLSVLTAPISGRFSGALDADGQVSQLEGGLDIGAGALQPTPATAPIRFDRAGLTFRLDPAAGKLVFSDLSVQGPSLRVVAEGQTFAADLRAGLPREFLGQVQIRDLQLDPEGLFTEPLSFSEGAVDFRLRLDPFRVEIGQVALREDGRQLVARGRAAATPEGWSLALDLSLNEIRHDKLFALWPVALIPQTRKWLVENVQQGLLFDVQAGLRIEPGAAPVLSLGYEFTSADVRILRTLPPVLQSDGHATISDFTYTLVMDAGTITAPQGGNIDVAGSVFRVPDIRLRPSTAEVTLRAASSVTAALALLDEPPFRFLTKAGRAVDVADGRAVTLARMRIPLVPRLNPGKVEYSVFATLYDVVSDRLVPGRRLTAPQLALTADRTGITISGPGRVGEVPFKASWTQALGAQGQGRSRIEGTVDLSPAFLDEFAIGLPEGSVRGTAKGQITIDLPRAAPGEFTLTSDLAGLAMRLDAIGWSKPVDRSGRLEVAGSFGSPPVVNRLSLTAPGLAAEGSVALRPSGELDRARFSDLQIGDWFDGAADLVGRGAGRAVGVEVRGGRADLRRLPDLQQGGAGGGSGPLSVTLDRLAISDKIALTGLRADLTTGAGVSGSFTARVNDAVGISGTLSPTPQGTGVRIRSDDAGRVLQAAGIFDTARGGALDMTLTPRGGRGRYDGRAVARDLRLVNAPVLAELMSAVSVIGLLEQMDRAGLVFTGAEADFRLSPAGVEIVAGSAVGASLGVSVAGKFDFASGRMNLQGVFSPLYLLNGVGSLFTRRGEGLFGFNYTITGTPEAPQIGVNPLSILTPGMFREIFRQPVPG